MLGKLASNLPKAVKLLLNVTFAEINLTENRTKQGEINIIFVMVCALPNGNLKNGTAAAIRLGVVDTSDTMALIGNVNPERQENEMGTSVNDVSCLKLILENACMFIILNHLERLTVIIKKQML